MRGEIHLKQLNRDLNIEGNPATHTHYRLKDHLAIYFPRVYFFFFLFL